eukprot:TRINITY_DN10599_c0_g2_i2.p2 TRINITY_DN10599_c0_g2~~TRINITY_DN10599_c0_g2_i2.p2  ORF type:complete len:290 (-),score=82.62 TRINITY_DN10599_c0_g2_i2:44-913(-)
MARSRSRGRKAAEETVDLDADDDEVTTAVAVAPAKGSVVIDCDLDDDGVVEEDPAAALENEILQAKREIKQEIKREKVALFDKHRSKEKKAKASSKVKKEKKDDDVAVVSKEKSRKEAKEGKDKKHRGRSGSRKRDKERKRRKSESSSSDSSSSSSEDDREPYEIFKPYTKVTLVNLVRKFELNGKNGQVVHPSVAVSPCPPGCVLVRLETGREIAIKPPNLRAVQAFHHGPQNASMNQQERLQQVLRSIRLNVDSVSERTEELRGGGGSALIINDGKTGPQGGIGHVV